MANKKINELTALTTPDNADLLVIDDVSATQTKKITFQNLAQAISGSPGGSSGQVQYNNAGVFGGVSNLTWNGSSLFATGSFKGNLEGNASTASALSTTTFFISLNGRADGVSTNVGSAYISNTITISTNSLAYIGGSTASETAILKLVPIGSATASATWTRTNLLGSAALSSPVSLAAGWYDVVLETGSVVQTGFARGLYLTT